MARPSWSERLAALDAPSAANESEAIWASVRPLLVMVRLGMILVIIAVGELMDDTFHRGLSIGVWGLIVGIPLFVVMSMFIAYVDHRTGWNEGKTTASGPASDEG